MKRYMTMIALALILAIPFAHAKDLSKVRFNYISIAVSATDWQDATKRLAIKNALCGFMGMPTDDISMAEVMAFFKTQTVKNVVGSTEYAVTAGATYYVCTNALKNWFMDNKAEGRFRLERMRELGIVGLLIRDITPDSSAWVQRAWGIVDATPPEPIQ